jgi:hypothetical protein
MENTDNKKEQTEIESTKNGALQNISKRLILDNIDVWIKDNEKIFEELTKLGMINEANVYMAYSQAYWNVKQFIESNK